MNKTITIYELLGLVKDGKAPKKIKYANNIWEYYDGIDYKNHETFLFDACCRINSEDLRSIVEIIEDNAKLEKIKWNEKESRAGLLRTDQEIEVLARRTETLKKKIAELVDHVNKTEEKLDV